MVLNAHQTNKKKILFYDGLNCPSDKQKKKIKFV